MVADKLAVRAVVYDDHHGGYIDNVPSTFTRSNQDLGNSYWNITPTGGHCPNGQPAGAAGLCSPPNSGQVNNFAIAEKNFNPVDYQGGRVSVLYEINPDWDVLIAESISRHRRPGPVGGIPHQFGLPAPAVRCRFPPSCRRSTTTAGRTPPGP